MIAVGSTIKPPPGRCPNGATADSISSLRSWNGIDVSSSPTLTAAPSISRHTAANPPKVTTCRRRLPDSAKKVSSAAPSAMRGGASCPRCAFQAVVISASMSRATQWHTGREIDPRRALPAYSGAGQGSVDDQMAFTVQRRRRESGGLCVPGIPRMAGRPRRLGSTNDLAQPYP
jgi:hypothetical protein